MSCWFENKSFLFFLTANSKHVSSSLIFNLVKTLLEMLCAIYKVFDAPLNFQIQNPFPQIVFWGYFLILLFSSLSSHGKQDLCIPLSPICFRSDLLGLQHVQYQQFSWRAPSMNWPKVFHETLNDCFHLEEIAHFDNNRAEKALLGLQLEGSYGYFSWNIHILILWIT